MMYKVYKVYRVYEVYKVCAVYRVCEVWWVWKVCAGIVYTMFKEDGFQGPPGSTSLFLSHNQQTVSSRSFVHISYDDFTNVDNFDFGDFQNA